MTSYVLYPQVFMDYEKHLKNFDNTSVIPTPAFFYGLQSGEEISVEIEPGKQVAVAMDVPWRFWVDGSPAVSTYRRGGKAARRRAAR